MGIIIIPTLEDVVRINEIMYETHVEQWTAWYTVSAQWIYLLFFTIILIIIRKMWGKWYLGPHVEVRNYAQVTHQGSVLEISTWIWLTLNLVLFLFLLFSEVNYLPRGCIVQNETVWNTKILWAMFLADLRIKLLISFQACFQMTD